MKITFKSSLPTDREVELTPKEVSAVFELMKYQLATHIEFTTAFNHDYTYQDEGDRMISHLCESHGIDVECKKDRMAFFHAILNNMQNPYSSEK